MIDAKFCLDARDANDEQTPLHRAAEIGNFKMLKKLLFSGATVDLRDKKDRTALFLISGIIGSKDNIFDCIKVLIDSKADVNSCAITWSELEFASMRTTCFHRIGHLENVDDIAKLFFDAGVDYNLTDWQNKTAYACAKKDAKYSSNPNHQKLADTIAKHSYQMLEHSPALITETTKLFAPVAKIIAAYAFTLLD